MVRTARRGLESQSAASREQVQAAFAVQRLPQPVEKRFAYPIGRGAQTVRVGKFDKPAAVGAPDDANLIYCSSPRTERQPLPSPSHPDQYVA